jgi:hypothetical protein
VVHLAGAVSSLDDKANAVGHRTAPLILNINARWADPAESEAHIRWTRELWEAVRLFPSEAST